MALDSRTTGEDGPRVVLLHGLFGQGRNFTSVATALAARGWRVTTLDLPNHGHSPWTDRQDYGDMADAVAAELDALREADGDTAGGRVRLLGHSMGGKTAMTLALRRPELLAALVVVDIAPVDYGRAGGGGEDMAGYVATMAGLDLSTVDTRGQADAALAEAVPAPATRAFLLQNLVRDRESGWRWRLNLDVLARDVPGLGGFPEPPAGAQYEGPVLWLAGGDSSYVRDADRPRMLELFPRTRLVRFKGVGHWVHAQAPELFVETVGRFLDSTR